MNDSHIREQLSALMDGELPPDTSRFLTKRLSNDAELAADWERWHVLRDCLRQQGELAPVDFCAGVRARIEQESSAPRLEGAPARNWRPLWGGAIAAGVAAMALIFGRVDPNVPAPAEATLAQVASVTTADLAPELPLSRVDSRESLVVDSVDLSEFDRYFLDHGVASGASGVQGVVPYVLVIASPAAASKSAETPR